MLQTEWPESRGLAEVRQVMPAAGPPVPGIPCPPRPPWVCLCCASHLCKRTSTQLPCVAASMAELKPPG